MPVAAKPRVLVVDDDLFVRLPLEAVLADGGFEPDSAADGHECMEKLERNLPDLIILDVTMPGPDGFEVCKTIKNASHYADIPVILLSARDSSADRARGLDSGASDFLSKPYLPAELLNCVRQLLAKA